MLVLRGVVLAVLHDQALELREVEPFEEAHGARGAVGRHARVQHEPTGPTLEQLCERLLLLDAPAHRDRVAQHDQRRSVQ